MRKNIKLFIANQEVDCSEGISLPMTYTVEDFQNPTIVKNSFSKTISIPGTKNNNKIFGEIYKLDRLLHIKDGNISGIYFDPSKRVDFQIYNNSYLVESGYMQLNSISINKAVITYNITLYGGLGDFFYGLKYKEDGEIRTLADLQYFVTDEDGNLLPEDEEMNFIINKDFVDKCFSYPNVNNNANTIYDFVTFTPSYNGLYENFDNETCLINTNGTSLFPTSASDSGNTYTPYNGYALASLNKAYTEWEMRDLRSYMQRPAIKLSKLIETICRKENSGYDVIFDDSFFNSSNPYWDKTYVALPLLGSNSDEGEESITENAQLQKYNDKFWCGLQPGGSTTSVNTGIFTVAGSTVIVPGENGVINLSGIPASALSDIDLPVQLVFNANTSTSVNDLYLSYVLNGKLGSAEYRNHPYRTSVTLQLLVYNADESPLGRKPIAYSSLYNFTNSIQGQSPAGPNTWFNYYPLTDAKVETVLGNFKKYQDNLYTFTSQTGGGNVFHLTVTDIPRVENISIYLQVARRTESLYNQDVMWSSNNMKPGTTGDYAVAGWSEVLFDNETYSLTASWASSVASETIITKYTLLRTENSPADFLLSYAKLFGLYFSKDIDSKTVRIYTRNNFFKDKINDWSDRIDYSKDITVNPLLFDKKWYTMALETPETYYANKYDKQYDITYGQQRLDTGYNFNSDNTDLYSDNIYENIVSARDVDKYFRNFYNSNNVSVPAFMNDNITYSLYRTVSNERTSYDQDLYGANFIDVSKTVEWWNVPGNDIFAKNCFYSLDNAEQSLEEIKSALVMYNGNVAMNDMNGNPIEYWITDDIAEMALLNDGENCFLYTASETDSSGKKIAIKRTTLPQFVRYVDSSNYVTASLDFGLPREIYVDKIKYDEDSTIYYQFWRAFYNDQFDVNTKKVTCYVKMNDLDIKYDLLREFYYFDSAYWILNKIDSYDINSDATTRCEFIKVQNVTNYLYGIPELGDYIIMTPNNIEVPYTAGTTTIQVSSNIPWEVGYYNSSKITGITPTSGDKGVTNVNISYNENEDYDSYNFYARFQRPGGTAGWGPAWNCVQLPDPSKTVKLSGTVKLSNGTIPEYSFHICASNSNFTNCIYATDSTGYYSLYVQKGVPFDFEVQGEGGTPIYNEELTLNEDTIKNITI